MGVLSNWRRFITVPYADLTADDLRAATKALDCATSANGTPYKRNAKNSMYRILRQFVQWMIDEEIIAIKPSDIKKILKAPAYDRFTERAADMLSEQDVIQIIEACTNARDRALIATLYESGARVGEIARMTWQDLVFDHDSGVKATIRDHKTDTTRMTWLVTSRPYLSQWRAAYPGPIVQNSIVFISLSRGALPYKSYYKILKCAAKAAGIKKRVHLHLFRKSRATTMAKEGYDDRAIKKSIWGRETSVMADVYIQLSGRDTIDMIKRKHGTVVPVTLVEPRTVRCVRCGGINVLGTTKCIKCGRNPLGEKSVTVADLKREFVDQLLADPRIAEIRKILVAGSDIIVGVPHDDDDQAPAPMVAR